MELKGAHCVVTGAGRGIGAALARRFHEAGAVVTLADLAGATETAAALDGTTGLEADVSTEDGNVALIRAAEEANGPIDLFFANAGISGGTGELDTPEDLWDLTMRVNFHAHRWAAKHLVPGWVARGGGYFCSTASAAGLLSQIGSAPYTVSKHAAVSFAEWLSITYGDRGLTVSCLCPQGVDTDMLRSGDDLDGPNGSDIVKHAGEVLSPAHVADVVADAIAAERFLILPHPEVQGYREFKVGQPDRWLQGMRKLQQTVFGGAR